MATVTAHYPARNSKIPAAVLGVATAAAVMVTAVVAITHSHGGATPTGQAVETAPVSGLGYVFSDAVPSDIVDPAPVSGLGYVFSDAFPSDIVDPAPVSGLGYVFSDAFPSDLVVAD